MSFGFLRSFTPGSPRNDLTAEIGFKFRSHQSRMEITKLGRYVLPGHVGAPHTLRLWDAAAVEIASVTIDTTGAPEGQYLYADMPTPFEPEVGIEFWLTSSENTGSGDPWYSYDTTVVPQAGEVISAAYKDAGGMVGTGGANNSYGPVNFDYLVIGNSVNNPGGQGDRTATCTITTDILGDSGSPTELINGLMGDTYWWSQGQMSKHILFDFGDKPRNINSMTWYQSQAASHGFWRYRVSNDGVSYFEMGNMFELGHYTPQTIMNLVGCLGRWRYYRMEQVAGLSTTSSVPYIQEVEFAIDSGIEELPESIKIFGGPLLMLP